MEQDFFVGYHNFAGKQQTLSHILGKLRGQVLPDISSFETYLQALYRRDVSACTLRTVFTAIHGFLVFLQRRGKVSLSSLTLEDLEAFVESEQDRGLKSLSVRGRLHQVYAFLRYLWGRGMVPADVLTRRIWIKEEIGDVVDKVYNHFNENFFEILFFIPHSAMHHVGCMAAQNPTWFWAQPAIKGFRGRSVPSGPSRRL